MPGRLAVILALLTVSAASPAASAPKKALFDNTHAETAGNADWQIDTDQPVPLPAQSGVTWATPRTYWLGAISSWGIDLVKRGYSVATLTAAYGITYGNGGNPYDLSNFDVFIVDEPNTRFTAAESTAIFNYVRDGGGLVAVCDHANSDRNSDGVDSPKAWGRLDRQHLWGAHFDSTGEGTSNNIVQDSANIDAAPDNPVIRGVNGFADSLAFHNGTTMHLYPATNPGVRGDVWMIGLSHGTSGVMAAHSTYGQGRIFFLGDSSPCDDGSAAPGNSSIFDGWGEVSGRDSLLIMNGTMWATRTGDVAAPSVTLTSPNGGEVWAMGSGHNITWGASDNVGVTSIQLEYSTNNGGAWNTIVSGLANSGSFAWTLPALATTQALVRVTAADAANNSATDPSNAAFTIADQTAPAVAVTAPNGGETYVPGETHAITWTASDNVGVAGVDIYYSSNDGGTWTSLAASQPNSGTWSWLVPDDPTTQALVKVVGRDAAGNATTDLSNSDFTISSPSAVPGLPARFVRPVVLQNRPNPFNPVTTIGFGLPEPGRVRLQIYSAAGRLVRTLVDRSFAAGYSEVLWDGRTDEGAAAPSGVYFYRFESGKVVEAKRLVMSR